MPSITQKPIGRNCGFQNQLYAPIWFVVHFTGGTPSLQSLYNYWLSQCGVGSNSHFGIERTDNAYAKAGDIWQFLPLTDGACANCCLGPGCAPFLPTNVNLNVRTISVECINPSSENAGNMPQAQYDSLVYLIQTVCKEKGIRTDKYTEYSNYEGVQFTFGDGQGGVIMHRDIDYQNRKRCPGMDVYNNQMKQLMKDVNGGGSSSGGTDERAKYMQMWGSKKNDMVIRMWNAEYDFRNQKLPAEQQATIPRRDTGIFNKWKEMLEAGNYIGGVLSDEYQFNSDNAAYMVQNFAAGQISYHTGNRTYAVIYSG
jgi:hypothetical protein